MYLFISMLIKSLTKILYITRCLNINWKPLAKKSLSIIVFLLKYHDGLADFKIIIECKKKKKKIIKIFIQAKFNTNSCFSFVSQGFFKILFSIQVFLKKKKKKKKNTLKTAFFLFFNSYTREERKKFISHMIIERKKLYNRNLLFLFKIHIYLEQVYTNAESLIT